jgi:hypothetical protein
MAMRVKKLKWVEQIGVYYSSYCAGCPMWGLLVIEDSYGGWHCYEYDSKITVGNRSYKTAQHCMAAIERMRKRAILECLEGGTND